MEHEDAPRDGTAAPDRPRCADPARNSNGQLGDGSTTSTTSPVPVFTGGVLAGRTLAQIVAGASSTCALDSTGLVYCWGSNGGGQLGINSTTTKSLVPWRSAPPACWPG